MTSKAFDSTRRQALLAAAALFAATTHAQTRPADGFPNQADPVGTAVPTRWLDGPYFPLAG
ncbi:MAG: hypothetical protein IPJ18_21390 [Betaproteobacteria bacterium]|nr:hypothetical protein [Betaproteobacteria bacterium]